MPWNRKKINPKKYQRADIKAMAEFPDQKTFRLRQACDRLHLPVELAVPEIVPTPGRIRRTQTIYFPVITYADQKIYVVWDMAHRYVFTKWRWLELHPDIKWVKLDPEESINEMTKKIIQRRNEIKEMLHLLKL